MKRSPPIRMKATSFQVGSTRHEHIYGVHVAHKGSKHQRSHFPLAAGIEADRINMDMQQLTVQQLAQLPVVPGTVNEAFFLDFELLIGCHRVDAGRYHLRLGRCHDGRWRGRWLRLC